MHLFSIIMHVMVVFFLCQAIHNNIISDPSSPSQPSKVWSILAWNMSCNNYILRPKGIQRNHKWPNSELKVVK